MTPADIREIATFLECEEHCVCQHRDEKSKVLYDENKRLSNLLSKIKELIKSDEDENGILPDSIHDQLTKRFQNVTFPSKHNYAFDLLAEMQLEMDAGKAKSSGRLFKTSLEKSLFSSPAACRKSIEARLKKLYKKYTADDISDIRLLEELHTALGQVTPENFTRYQKLLELLRSDSYGWNPKDPGDRVVIFTERIETMNYLAEHLRTDLGLKSSAIQEISGGMSDAEQQRIVEDFGRTESSTRILVASDVASEGLNLHYLSHRLIHFDIPWSLMVFQQRNGRIDRYGQQKRPDIRYLLIESNNKQIKGDMRIIEILIQKEEQALKNIGDPALLLGKFNVEEEETVIAEAIESGSDADTFAQSLDADAQEFNPFEALMAAASETEETAIEQLSETVSDETLFTDKEYLEQAVQYINQTDSNPVQELQTVSGLDIRLTPEMERRLRALIPEEAMPQGETLRLSDDKAFCMEQMRTSMQKNMDEAAWPSSQYLWKLHPIFSWVNDKAGLLFKRAEAPVLGLPGVLYPGEALYIVSGSVPNLKSTPLIDEWFGLLYRDGQFIQRLSMEEVVQKAGLRSARIPNTNCITNQSIVAASSLLHDVVTQAKTYLTERYQQYQAEMNPKLDAEVDKLIELQEKHKEYYQTTLFEHERQLQEQERRVDKLFDDFTNWVKETLTIQNNPYIRIVSVLMGVSE